jgi:hypothetical protein
MSKKIAKASSLQKVLITIVIIAICASAVGFYYVQNALKEKAISVGQSITESAASGGANTSTIKSLQIKIDASEDASEKVAFLTSEESTYQNQMVADITAYASNTNIKITGYTFSSSSTSSSEVLGANKATASDDKTGTMTLTIGNPVKFVNLMKFIKSIETNIPIMQITDLKITNNKSTEGTVTVDPMKIDIYIK